MFDVREPIKTDPEECLRRFESEMFIPSREGNYYNLFYDDKNDGVERKNVKVVG